MCACACACGKDSRYSAIETLVKPKGKAMNESDRRNLEMHRLVAGKIQRDPLTILKIAIDNIQKYRREHGDHPYMREWESVIGQGPNAVIALLSDEGERGQVLRSSSPFAGALNEQERREAIARAHSAARQQTR